MNISSLHINNSRFSIRLYLVSKNYGLKTIGQLERMTARMKPNARLVAGTFPNSYIRVARITKELEKFREEQ